MPYSDEELLADIRAVADVVERSPSLQDYRDHGEYSVTTIYRRFDSWQGAVARAGFEPRDPNTRTSNADLIDALQELADELGESPTTRQMNEHGRYWSKAYRDRFGSWVTHSTPPGSIRSTTTRIVVSPTPTYSTSSNDSPTRSAAGQRRRR